MLFITRLFLRLGAVLPLPVLHALGAVAGWIGSLVPNRPRQLTERNLELCFPELGAPERRRMTRRSLVEDGKAIVELGAFWCRSRDRVMRLVASVEGEQHLHAAMRDGNGVLLAAPHLGAWELGGIWFSVRGRMAALYRPPHTREFESLLNELRGRFGARLLAAGRRGLRELIRELREGSIVAILPDQLPSGGEGVFVPFFGIQANTMTLLPKLAQRTGASVLVAWMERLPRGRGYRLHIDEPWRVPVQMSPEEAATELNRRVEQQIRRCPLQYQWSYKRFFHRPPGEPPIYPPKRKYSGRPSAEIR